MYLQLVEFDSIIIFADWIRLRTYLMVLFHEIPRKAAKHLHDAKFILIVGITGRGIEDYFLDRSFPTDDALSSIAAP